MTKEEMINTLKEMDKKRVEQLNENSKKLFNAIMKIADERDKYREDIKEYQKELEKADSITQSCIYNGKINSEISYRKSLNELEKYKKLYHDEKLHIKRGIQELKNQQKEFIEWLENEIQKQKDYGASFGLTIDRDIAEYISEKITVYKDVLSKYKEIMGGDNNG